MSKRAKLEEDQSEQVHNFEKKPDSGLLETFNQALSSIISHQKTSISSTTKTFEHEAEDEEKSRPVIWFPDEDVRSSPTLTTQHNFPKETKYMEQPVQKDIAFDKYDEWVDGNTKCRYALTSREAQSHSSGWAMKYTNNHNKFVLKKTCVGVLLCSENCTMKNGNRILIRPAISDKVRERQLDQPCPNPDCRTGRIIHLKCSGNNGYPVTHFWVHHNDSIQFEAKGNHNHPRPEAKRTTIRKKEDHFKYGTALNNLFYAPEFCASNKEFGPFVHQYPQPTETFADFLDNHGDCIQSWDVTDGNEHVCFTSPHMRSIAQQIIGNERHVISLSKPYVLCRTLPNYVHGFSLLESRIISCDIPECPLLLVTLYRTGSVDGIIEHIRHLAAMCSPSHLKIRVPKWHLLVHDFEQDLLSLVVETIVNLMVDSQMQILLNEFQYKSVSSLYKMLRQRMLGTMRTFKEHFMVCKYELLLKIPDPIRAASLDEILSHLQTYTAKEYMNADTLIKDGVFGSQVREFWHFWGHEVISPAVFPAASTVYAPILHQHTAHCAISEVRYQGRTRLQDAFLSLTQWLERRAILCPPTNVYVHSYHKQQPKLNWISPNVPQYSNSKTLHGMPVVFSYGSCHGDEVAQFRTNYC